MIIVTRLYLNNKKQNFHNTHKTPDFFNCYQMSASFKNILFFAQVANNSNPSYNETLGKKLEITSFWELSISLCKCLVFLDRYSLCS